SGRACASFRLAVNHWRVDKDTGEFVTDGTSWFSVDCYGDLASNSCMSLHSGTAVIVTGTLKIRQWETEKRSGIAPTVVTEHIGAERRYGTANTRRTKATERAQSQAGQAARESDSPQSSGWDALSDTSADGGQSASGDGTGTAESAGSGESVADAVSSADAEESAKAREGAIARDTAE